MYPADCNWNKCFVPCCSDFGFTNFIRRATWYIFYNMQNMQTSFKKVHAQHGLFKFNCLENCLFRRLAIKVILGGFAAKPYFFRRFFGLYKIIRLGGLRRRLRPISNSNTHFRTIQRKTLSISSRQNKLFICNEMPACSLIWNIVVILLSGCSLSCPKAFSCKWFYEAGLVW